MDLLLNIKNHFKLILPANKPIYILYYEDLKKDPIAEMQKLLMFPPLKKLLNPFDAKSRLLCLSEQQDGYFKRKKSKMNLDIFNNNQKFDVNEIIKDTRELLSNYGYELPHYEIPFCLLKIFCFYN